MRLFIGHHFFLAMSMLAAEPEPLSPAALAVSPDGKVLYVACTTANRVVCFDITNRNLLHSISLPDAPTGLTL